MDAKAHWDTIYSTRAATEVSWYQREPTLSLELIRRAAPEPSAAILDVGGGASTLVDSLLSLDYASTTVLDIAAAALASAQARLGDAAHRVRWIAADVLDLSLPAASIDVWHDRAVFHFLLTPEARARYVEQLRRVVRPGGHVVIATFAEDGPARCSGLSVCRYDPDELTKELGTGFRMLETMKEQHQTPSGGSQSFRYCLFVWEGAGPGSVAR